MFFFLAKKARDEQDVAGYKNNLTYGLVLLGALVLALLNTFRPILVYPLDLITLLFLAAFLPIFYVLSRREKKAPHFDDYERPEEGLTFRYEVIRKATHFVVVGIFLVYFYFGPYFMGKFNDWMARTPEFWGIAEFDAPGWAFGQYFVVFWVVISFFGLSVAEFVRIMRPEAYPLKKVNRILRKDELRTKMGPHIAMTTGVFAVVLTIGPYAPLVACAAIGIGVFGDAAANIIGRKFGRHHIRKSKTIEGMIGGAAVSFLTAFGFLIYEELLSLTPSGSVVGHAAFIAFGGTLTFVLVDFFSPSISDNLLNPLLCGITMSLLTVYVIF